MDDIIANATHIPTFLRACPAVGTGHFLLYDVREPGLLCPCGLRPGGLDVEPDRVEGKEGVTSMDVTRLLVAGTSPRLVHNPPTKGNGLAAHFQSGWSYKLSDLWDVYEPEDVLSDENCFYLIS